MRFISVVRPLIFLAVLIGSILADLQLVSAQVPAPTSTVVAGRDSKTFPPPPMPFYRGSHPTDRRFIGFYFNNVLLVCLLGLFTLWVWTSEWIDTDAHELKVRPRIWNTIFLFSGVGGFLLALCCPTSFLSFLVMTSGYAIPMGIYVAERNRRVPESGKVLTPRHLKLVGMRVLSKLGVRSIRRKFVVVRLAHRFD